VEVEEVKKVMQVQVLEEENQELPHILEHPLHHQLVAVVVMVRLLAVVMEDQADLVVVADMLVVLKVLRELAIHSQEIQLPLLLQMDGEVMDHQDMVQVEEVPVAMVVALHMVEQQ
tara:strand:+ start:258 stop:605 length:348 start_codon:yes stop_codon:yes gene_type:complete